MLTCKDMAYAKNEKGEVVATKTYDRIYFEYGPNDPTEEKPVTVEGKEIGKRTKPKADTTVHNPDELFAAAIEYIQKQKPKTNAMLAMLGEYSYAADLGVRSTLRNQMLPPKPVDEDKAVEKAAKQLVALGYASDLAAAITMVRNLKAQQAPTA